MKLIKENYLSRKISPNKISRIFQYIFITIWIILIAIMLVFFWDNRDYIIPYILNLNISYLFYAFLFYIVSFIFALCGWSSILHSFDIDSGWWKNAQIYCATLVARRLPGTIWYIGGRLVFYEMLGISKMKILAASGVELVVIFLSGIFLGLPLITLSGRNPIPLQLVLVGIGLAIGAALVYPLSRLYGRKKSEFDLLVRINNKLALLWIILYGLTWIFGGLMLYEVIYSFSIIKSNEILTIIGAWTIAGTAGFLTFFLPSAFGATELALAFLLSQSIPLPIAGAIAIIMRLLTTVFELLLSMITYPFLKRQTYFKNIDV